MTGFDDESFTECSLINYVKKAFSKAICKAFEGLDCNNILDVTKATKEEFGHYQCNSAMKLARILKQPPMAIAKEIVAALVAQKNDFNDISIAGAGFINIKFSKSFLSKKLNLMLKSDRFYLPLVENRDIIVEFSSPNVAKEMHVGHLRSTIIGDCIARTFEFLGFNVKRLNHIGDWGTAFGMLIAYILKNNISIESPKIEDLMHWYKESKKLFDQDEDFKEQARNYVVKLQSGDEQTINIWTTICDVSRKEFNNIYEQLDVVLEERGESFYNNDLSAVVSDLENKGLITISDGAKCVFHEGLSIPLMVQKSDGGYNYDTTDVAAMKYRIEHDKVERIIVVTDSGQSLHFKLVEETCKKAGYLNVEEVRFDHVVFGLVLGNDGKKFKTRSGETEKLIDLINKAKEEAGKVLEEKENNSKELASIIGINAIKYADLSCHRIQDYQFSYERMLKFDGNTAPFIMYSDVRIQGIKRKLKITEEQLIDILNKHSIEIETPSEVSIALVLGQFHEILSEFEDNLCPHIITDYLYNLACAFNLFFRDCRVEGTAEEKSRILLSELTSKILRKGMELIGLRFVDEM